MKDAGTKKRYIDALRRIEDPDMSAREKNLCMVSVMDDQDLELVKMYLEPLVQKYTKEVV